MCPEDSISFKERRIKEVMIPYYSRQDVRKNLYDFSKHRESIPRYFEGFGKRPDNFQYPSDILELVKKGATSFHCSEELWSNALEISNELTKQEFDELRVGWDLLLDIDSPYIEYSKIYAELIINELESHGLKNIGLKFSGSKGFHIIVPWKGFPEKVYGQETKNMFPEWPRIICQYLSELVKPKLADKIGRNIEYLAEKTGKKQEELVIRKCVSCNRPASKIDLVTWFCPHCGQYELTRKEKSKRIPKCPECRKQLEEKFRETIHQCKFCGIDSKNHPELFDAKERLASEKLIDADLILVAPRHLFRMPNSLHEKTALASIVLEKSQLRNFQLKDANAFKIKIKNFYPKAEENEARNLLLKALSWQEENDRTETFIEEKKDSLKNSQKSFDVKKPSSSYKKISIPNPSEDLFPPCIKKILKGVKHDGRKRALFILLSFFRSLGVSYDELEKRINQWNEKNYQPLKKPYIQSQLFWQKKNKAFLPPNCDKPNYRELDFCHPDELCKTVKNPINYSFKKYFKK